MKLRIVLLVAKACVGVLVAAGCTASGKTAQSTTPSLTSRVQANYPSTAAAASTAAKTTRVATCVPAAQSVVVAIAGGLNTPATGLRDAVSVATTASEQASTEHATEIVAARVGGAGDAIGMWSEGNGTIDALNEVARKYSSWGSAAQADSPAQVARDQMARWPETNAAQGCAAASKVVGPAAPTGVNSCGKDLPDVIEWFVTAGTAPTAQELGGWDLANCTRTDDQAALDASSPQDPGACTIVASVAANPGYNLDASPAPKPKGILAMSGPAC